MSDNPALTSLSDGFRDRPAWRTREEMELEKRRESLLLSRDRLRREVEVSTSLALRIARERALEHVEQQLVALAANPLPLCS